MKKNTRTLLILWLAMTAAVGTLPAQRAPGPEEAPSPGSPVDEATEPRWLRRQRERKRQQEDDSPARPLDDRETSDGDGDREAGDSPASPGPAVEPGPAADVPGGESGEVDRESPPSRDPALPPEDSPAEDPDADPESPADASDPSDRPEGEDSPAAIIGPAPSPDPSASPASADDSRDLQNVVSSPPSPTGATRPERIHSLMPWVLYLRREIHRRPELGFHEDRTAAIVGDALEAMGYQVRRGVGGTGVVAVLRGARPGRTVAYRADMDALPIREETGLSFASQVRRAAGDSNARGDEARPGVMHACGHDVHLAVLIGTARLLADEVRQGAGSVIFVAQPAEELGKGAQAMLSDGIFQGHRPDSILALHVVPHLATGQVGWGEGPATANSDNFRIVIRGDGGHGAFPHQTIDPVVIGSQVVVALQVLVAREIDAHEAAVITVGSFHAGTRANIIPDSAELKVTVRTIKDEVRNEVLEKIERTVRGICQAAGAPSPVITRGENPTRAGINEPALARRCRPVLEALLGLEQVVAVPPAMGNEDFFRFSAVAPAFMFQLGVTDAATLEKRGPAGVASIHSPHFVADENAIPVGILAASTLLLSELGSTPLPAATPSP